MTTESNTLFTSKPFKRWHDVEQNRKVYTIIWKLTIMLKTKLKKQKYFACCMKIQLCSCNMELLITRKVVNNLKQVTN